MAPVVTVRLSTGERVRIAGIDSAEMPPRATCGLEAKLAVAAKARLQDLGSSHSVYGALADAAYVRFARLNGYVSASDVCWSAQANDNPLSTRSVSAKSCGRSPANSASTRSGAIQASRITLAT